MELKPAQLANDNLLSQIGYHFFKSNYTKIKLVAYARNRKTSLAKLARHILCMAEEK